MRISLDKPPLNELTHYGVLGMKWGVRKTKPKTERVFVSGTSKMQSKDSEYYRDELDKEIRNHLDSLMNKKVEFLIGDCVGVDAMVQGYLATHKYDKVHIYVSGNEVRNNADDKGSLGWKVHGVNANKFEKGSKEWHAVKDEVMNKIATSGLAVILDEGGAKATRKNIDRFIKTNKDVAIYQVSSKGKNQDRKIDINEYKNQEKS